MPRPIDALAAAAVLAAACTDPIAPAPPVARPVVSRLPAGPPSDGPASPARTLDYHAIAAGRDEGNIWVMSRRLTDPPAVYAGRSLVPVRFLARGLDSRIRHNHYP